MVGQGECGVVWVVRAVPRSLPSWGKCPRGGEACG